MGPLSMVSMSLFLNLENSLEDNLPIKSALYLP